MLLHINRVYSNDGMMLTNYVVVNVCYIEHQAVAEHLSCTE